MQAIILAAGRGVRMGELTKNTPKPMLKISGVPILERTINILPDDIKQVVIVIGYLGDQIRAYFGDEFKGRRIVYIEQREQKGPFHALKLAEPVLNEEFLVLMADDLYAAQDLRELKINNRAVLVKHIMNQGGRFGSCAVENGFLRGISERATEQICYCNCGAYKLTKDFLEEPVIRGPNGEELLSIMVGNYAKNNDVRAITATSWFPLANADDMRAAQKIINNL